MKRMNKTLAIVLSLVMLVAVLPTGIFAQEGSEATASAVNNGYLWDFEDKAVGTKLSDADFKNKVDQIVWGGDGAYTTANWETMVDPEDENNIVLNPLMVRAHVPSGNTKTETVNDYLTNGINFNNFGKQNGTVIEFAYDIYMTARGKAVNDIPLLRIYYTANGSGANRTMMTLNTSPEVAPNDPNTSKATSMGKVQVGDNNYGGTVTGTELFAMTWYRVRMQFDTMSGTVACYVDDVALGTATISGWNPETHQINYFIGLRCYNADHSVTAYVDDIYLGYVTELAKSDFESTSDFGFEGFKLTTNTLTKWSVATDAGNTYMKHTGDAQPLTWSDVSNWLDRGSFSYSFDFKSDTGNSGGLLSVTVDEAAAATNRELRIIHQNGRYLTFGPTVDTKIGMNIAEITTGSSAKWHNIKTVFKPYISEGRIDMLYEFYVDGALAAYTDIVESVDDEGNLSYSYNFYTKVTGEWTVKTDLKNAIYRQYITEGDDNQNGVADEGETVTYGWKWITSACPYIDANNAPRSPFGYWDGYYRDYIDGENVDGVTRQDGKIAKMVNVYMFHYNANTFGVDNLKISLPEVAKTVESAELVGYQLGTDGSSVRFIAGVDSLNFGQVGMDIQAFDRLNEDGWVTKLGNKMTNSVYMALTADGEQVAAKEAFGTRFLSMLSISDIDSSAVIRIRPYATKDGVKIYGDPVVYIVEYDNKSGVSVTPAPTYVRDYEDGVKKGSIGDGYAKSTYEQLINPDGDWGSGGEGGARAVSAVDGTMKIVVDKQFTSSKNGYVSYVDGETGETVYVLDDNGQKIPLYNSMSARYKLANVIPYDYDELVGNTVIISARIKVAGVKKLDTTGVNVVGGDGKTYNVPTAVDYSEGKANVFFGFGDDGQWSYLGSIAAGNYRSYALSVSDEWVEIYAAIDVTEAFVANMKTAKDANGVQQPVPLRPTITLGNPDGWASEIYVDDVSCIVVPILAE